jgi:hypothetical protein
VDIKRERRDAAVTGKTWDKDLPEMEGMYPGDNGNPNRKGQGSAASDNNIGWDVRASSWARGADTDYMAIEKEKIENDKRFGTPHEDSFPAPSDPKGPKNCGARYQTASYDANDTLPNPHNFSNNPGFMGTSTGDMAAMGGPANGGTARIATHGAPTSVGARGGLSRYGQSGRATTGGSTGRQSYVSQNNPTVGRSITLGHGNVSLPAPGDVDPGSEGSPQVVTSGFSNG